MYFCTVTVHSRVVNCTLSSAHWQQASKLTALPCHEHIDYGDTEADIMCEYIDVCVYFLSRFLDQRGGVYMPLANMIFSSGEGDLGRVDVGLLGWYDLHAALSYR